MSEMNIICWVDIPVIDLDRAIKFYSILLAADVQKITEHGFVFGLLPHKDNNVSGCLSIMEDRQPSKSGPLIYLNVEGRLDQAISLSVANGGILIKNKEQIGPYGNRAILLDSEGNSIALYSK